MLFFFFNIPFIQQDKETDKSSVMATLFILIICLTALLSEAKTQIVINRGKNKQEKGPGYEVKNGKGPGYEVTNEIRPGYEAKFEEVKDVDGMGELGKIINLRGTDLLGDFQQKESSLFEKIPKTCFLKQDLFYTGSYYDYYASTKDFYSKLAVSTGLSVSLQGSYTLGATLTSVISSEQSSSHKVSGISLNVRALKEKVLVKKDCLDDDSETKLSGKVLQTMKSLPLHVKVPWQRNSWTAYEAFLKRFGSHVITSAIRGSSIKQTTFAQSDEAYSQRQFQIKACVSLSGPTEVGELGVQACANVSKTEISKTTSMNTIDKLIVRGGTKETRNALVKKRSKDLIEQLLNEAGKTPASVEHTFRAIWDILQSRFPIGSDNYVRAVNLQYYYLGYLNYGCEYEESGGVPLQKFDYTRTSTSKSPEYQCTLAAEGCHSNDDCHYKPIWCACRGKSCIGYKDIPRDTGEKKKHAFANTNSNWGWHGCGWYLAGSWCKCYNNNRNIRQLAWKMPSRDAPQKGASHGAYRDDDNSGQGQDPEVDEFSGGEKED